MSKRMRFYCDAGNLRDSWHGYSLMCAEGDHGLVQEDQGKLRRVCCCAAHLNDVRIKYILYAQRDVIHAPHALLQPSRRRTVLLLL